MTVLQQQVRHPQFGTGTVTAQADSYITVEFPAPYGTKNFLWPTAFPQFLTLTDETRNRQMHQEIEQAQVAAQALRQEQEAQEAARLAAERIAALAAKKKAASAKRASARKTAKG